MLHQCNQTVSPSSKIRNEYSTTQMLVPETQMRFNNGPETGFANRDKLSDEEFVHSSANPWPHLDSIDECQLIAGVSRHYIPSGHLKSTEKRAQLICRPGVEGEKSTDLDIWSSSTSNYAPNCDEMAIDDEESVDSKGDFGALTLGQPTPNICQGCKKIIEDRYLLNIGGFCWHENCAKCAKCFVKLSTSCFQCDGQLYCKQDYERTRKKCSGCSNQIEKDEMVMRVTDSSYVYHVACFACAMCKRLLRKGDEFIFNNGSPITAGGWRNCMELQCKSCWAQRKETCDEMMESSQFGSNNGNSPNTANMSPGPHSDVTDSLLSPKSLMCAMSPSKSDDDDGMSSDDDSTSGQLNSSKEENGEDGKRSRDGDDIDSKDSKRSKRPRTILNAVQRRAFKAAFEVTPKPCRKVRETLAKDTGLTVRVVQVWFQNQRAKMKKLAKRQQSQEAAAQKAREEFGFHGFDPMNPMLHHHLPHMMRDKSMMDASMYGYMPINQPGVMQGMPFTQIQCEQQQMGFPTSSFNDGMTYYEGVPNINVTSPSSSDCVPNQHIVGCNPQINQMTTTANNLNMYSDNMMMSNGPNREMSNENDIMPASHIRHSSGAITPIDSLYTMQNNYFNS